MSKPATLAAARKLVAGLGFKAADREREKSVSFLHPAGVEIVARQKVLRLYARRMPTTAQLKSLKIEAGPATQRKNASETSKWVLSLDITDAPPAAVRKLIESLIAEDA